MAERLNLTETKNKNYLYMVNYASGILLDRGRQCQLVSSTKRLKVGQFIIVEHIGCGIFIGRVSEFKGLDENNNCEYVFLKHVDVSDWAKKVDNQKRKKELEAEMESMFKSLDKKKKYEYYAEIDDTFRDLLLEYNQLSD